MVLSQDGGVYPDGGRCSLWQLRFWRGLVSKGARLSSISLILSQAKLIKTCFVVVVSGLLVNAADVFVGQRINRQLDLTAHV